LRYESHDSKYDQCVKESPTSETSESEGNRKKEGKEKEENGKAKRSRD